MDKWEICTGEQNEYGFVSFGRGSFVKLNGQEVERVTSISMKAIKNGVWELTMSFIPGDLKVITKEGDVAIQAEG